MTTIPTKNRLVTFFGSEDGDKLYAILKRPAVTCADKYTRAADHLKEAVHVRRMWACADRLGAKAVQPVAVGDGREHLTYCDRGDATAETIFHDSRRDAFYVKSWAKYAQECFEAQEVEDADSLSLEEVHEAILEMAEKFDLTRASLWNKDIKSYAEEDVRILCNWLSTHEDLPPACVVLLSRAWAAMSPRAQESPAKRALDRLFRL